MSDLYRDKVRARIPAGMRTRLAGAMLPAPPERPRSPALETVRWVLAQLEEEVRELRELTGGAVSWDAEAILERAARRLES